LTEEPKNEELFFRGLACAFRLVELLFRLLDFDFSLVLTGVMGGDTRADDVGAVGSCCWMVLRSRAAISSVVKFTLVWPLILACEMRSKADCSRQSSFSLNIKCGC
jgi:hypothetical protein